MKLARPSALAALAIFTLADPCLAVETATVPVSEPLAGIGQMLFGLAVVLGILAASVWLLKRLSSPMRGNALLRVLGVTAVGPRERVVLLEAGEKVLMLGVTPNNVRTLHVFARDELPIAPAAPATPVLPAAAASFADRLRRALKGRHDAD
jgi:flagellar protein FliO/FliZ